MPFEHKYFVKMPELQDLLKPLIKKRGGYKSCITVALNKLCSLSIDDLTKENFLRRQEAIEQYLQKVQDINDQILDVFLDKDVSETDPTKLDEISSQVEYTAQIHDELAKIECNIDAKSQPDVVTSKPDPLMAVNNIVQEGYTLAEPTLATNGESIPIQGLVGVDILQFIPNLHISKCMLGLVWSTPSGIVPFGNVLHFLHPNQVTPISSHGLITERPALDYRNVVSSLNDTPVTHVNFVLSPKKSYFSPLESLFPDSSVEQGLENMFSLDSLGCHEESNQSQYDTIMIEEFQRVISFKDNRYHVSLPWKENLVEKVPSNHKVALSVLNRVVNNLEQKGSLAAYQEVFHN